MNFFSAILALASVSGASAAAGTKICTEQDSDPREGFCAFASSEVGGCETAYYACQCTCAESAERRRPPLPETWDALGLAWAAAAAAAAAEEEAAAAVAGVPDSAAEAAEQEATNAAAEAAERAEEEAGQKEEPSSAPSEACVDEESFQDSKGTQRRCRWVELNDMCSDETYAGSVETYADFCCATCQVAVAGDYYYPDAAVAVQRKRLRA